ncbi:MAG: hypothetical protein C0501_14595 [Isosphaera sp.]|nr:hypothetical protein [Isosphaera sp.]
MPAERPANSSDLVMTQADLPPGVDVPEPEQRAIAARRAPADGEPSVEVVRRIRQLADRVGEIDKLRELVDELAQIPR